MDDDFVAPDHTIVDGLLVRPWRRGDGPALAATTNASHAHLAPWMSWSTGDDTPARSEARAQSFAGRYLAREDFVLSIWDGDELVGGSGFHPRWGGIETRVAEIGMWISADRAGRGVGTTVLRGVVAWGLSDAWPWDRLMWLCDAENIASARVAQKAGFTLEGSLRGPGPSGDGVGRDATLVFGLNRGDPHSSGRPGATGTDADGADRDGDSP
ncbi:GNAT family N-acetyltransferase [Salsipaludibacter albus]|uniref:GNAT family N-acetyltransferase n=1 Tax=Salsipaludibacter albus TaxID=2849650 RepID=UPI001EE454FB|nr:GNAT family protein [Salsipaludibacter albus]MBY5162611.1 GNAT family N-acetyltransferase [Salsipaludibacter albus]